MPTVIEGQLRFNFDDDLLALKFDTWSFYRNQFMKLAGANIHCSKCEQQLFCPACREKRVAGTKGIDILAVDIENECWLIEVKDYRATRVGDFTFLSDICALKVRDTLAALVAAARNANDAGEKNAAVQALACPRIRIVLHLEQPATHSIQQSKDTRRANVQQRLKQFVKAIDPHPQVYSHDKMGNVNWTVTQLGGRPS